MEFTVQGHSTGERLQSAIRRSGNTQGPLNSRCRIEERRIVHKWKILLLDISKPKMYVGEN